MPVHLCRGRCYGSVTGALPCSGERQAALSGYDKPIGAHSQVLDVKWHHITLLWDKGKMPVPMSWMHCVRTQRWSPTATHNAQPMPTSHQRRTAGRPAAGTPRHSRRTALCPGEPYMPHVGRCRGDWCACLAKVPTEYRRAPNVRCRPRQADRTQTRTDANRRGKQLLATNGVAAHVGNAACVACAGSSGFPISLHFRYDLNMAQKSVKVRPKKRGRPATGKEQLVGVRLPDATIRRIGNWAKREGVASRSDAIRRLLEQALVTVTEPSGRRRHKGESRAREWAGQEIDRRANQSLPAQERKRRKDRLTKGPSEFREMRDDIPKPKG